MKTMLLMPYITGRSGIWRGIAMCGTAERSGGLGSRRADGLVQVDHRLRVEAEVLGVGLAESRGYRPPAAAAARSSASSASR